MRRIPPIALVVMALTLGVFLPTPWIAPLTADLSAVLWVPLSPLSHGASAIRVWLRSGEPQRAPSDSALESDRDHFRGLWHAERLRVQELERRLAQYQAVAEADHSGSALKVVAADVLARTTTQGGVALKVNVGRRQGVAAGDVVIVGGDAVAGRVAPDVGELFCFVTSIAAKGTPRVDALLTPASEERARSPRTIPIQLVPDGTGFLVGDIELGSSAAPNDFLRIADLSWPRGAQGMRVGRVVEIRRKEAQPLRGEVVVAPVVDAATIAEVVIKLGAGSPP